MGLESGGEHFFIFAVVTVLMGTTLRNFHGCAVSFRECTHLLFSKRGRRARLHDIRYHGRCHRITCCRAYYALAHDALLRYRLKLVSGARSLGVFIPGFLVRLDSVPAALRWIRFINPFKWSFSAYAINELEVLMVPFVVCMRFTLWLCLQDITFTCTAEQAISGRCPIPNGQYILDLQGVEDDGGISTSILVS